MGGEDMIRIERDPEFWRWVAEDPAVAATRTESLEVLDRVLAGERVVPLASANGGFVFIPRDNLGKVYELHTMFRQEGWGREVLFAAKAAFEVMFNAGVELIFTFENTSNWRTRPPKSFRFRQCGSGEPWRLWSMSLLDWRQSPAYERFKCHLEH